jgi:hypothetical protein
MKYEVVVAAIGLLLAAVPLSSIAACATPSARVNTKAEVKALLEGNTACVPPVTQPTMEAQELHLAGGALIDYKKGSGHPVDPSTQVGTWAVTGADGRGVFVTYDYGNGQVYNYAVWNNNDNPRTYSLCSAKPEVKVRIKTGGGAC